MPPSRYVSSTRLMRMLVFLAGAVLLLVLTDVGLRWAGAAPSLRRTVSFIWLVAVPVGWWMVWKGGASDH